MKNAVIETSVVGIPIEFKRNKHFRASFPLTNCTGGESSQNGDYGEEILEGETGLGENTRVLGEKAIVEGLNGDEASDEREKIFKYVWSLRWRQKRT